MYCPLLNQTCSQEGGWDISGKEIKKMSSGFDPLNTPELALALV
jgi:hypothetical protein